MPRLGMEPMRCQLIASIALMASASALAAGGGGPAPASPKNAEKTSVSVSGMTAPDYAQCVSDLTSRRVLFEELGDVTHEGCKLSGAVKLESVTTALGTVSIPEEPAMLCSFARQFSGWVREVAAPLALGYAGQRRIETAQGFACKARYDKPGEVLPANTPKGTRSTSSRSCWPTAAASM